MLTVLGNGQYFSSVSSSFILFHLCPIAQDKVYERFLGRIAEDGRRKIEAIQSFGEDKILFVKGSYFVICICYTYFPNHNDYITRNLKGASSGCGQRMTM